MKELTDSLKKIALAGIGAAVAGYEKTAQIMDEFIKKGEATIEQGKVLNEELKHNIKTAVKDVIQVEEAVIDKEAIDHFSDEQLESLRTLIEQAQIRRKQVSSDDCAKSEQEQPDKDDEKNNVSSDENE